MAVRAALSGCGRQFPENFAEYPQWWAGRPQSQLRMAPDTDDGDQPELSRWDRTGADEHASAYEEARAALLTRLALCWMRARDRLPATSTGWAWLSVAELGLGRYVDVMVEPGF